MIVSLDVVAHSLSSRRRGDTATDLYRNDIVSTGLRLPEDSVRDETKILIARLLLLPIYSNEFIV